MRKRSIDHFLLDQGSAKPDQSLPRRVRLRSAAEIDRVFKEGVRFSGKGMRMIVLQTAGEESRVAFIPVRAFPNAVTRNRARRLAREAWRIVRASVKPGYDIVFVIYPGFAALSECQSAMYYLLRKADLMR